LSTSCSGLRRRVSKESKGGASRIDAKRARPRDRWAVSSRRKGPPTVGSARGEPFLGGGALAVRAVLVAAEAVDNRRIGAVLDCRHHLCCRRCPASGSAALIP